MSMPDNFVLVRHGQSEGNLATDASKDGDDHYYTDAFLTTPGHQWRLTEFGQEQAKTIGVWLAQEFPTFDRYYVSPYVRTRETAGTMGLPHAEWMMNRALRERDWGDIGSVPRKDFLTRPEFRENAKMFKMDPLYWMPPGGESIAHVAENRVRNILSTLHRECAEQDVIAVSHGEMMWAFRIMLERWNDEEYIAFDADKSMKIRNCQAIHYTRINPVTGERHKRLAWVRTATPAINEATGTWTDVVVSDWRRFDSALMNNEELLASVKVVPTLFR